MQERSFKPARILSFISEFENALKRWPSSVKWPLTQISIETKTDLPLIVECLMDVLNDPVDVHEPISYKEAERSLFNLKQRMHHEIVEQHRRLERERERSVAAYEKIVEKVRDLQTSKNWYNAYKTLSYFAGSHEKNLNTDILLSIWNECIRLGIKAGVNFQELACWLQKGVDLTLRNRPGNSVEEALDFLDAYEEYLEEHGGEKAKKFLLSLLSRLDVVAIEPQTKHQIETMMLRVQGLSEIQLQAS